MTIRSEAPTDHDAIRSVHEAAFGRDAEARLVDDLRAGGYARLSLVAEGDGRVVGHILFSSLSIETALGTVEALALAPLAVHPGSQGRGTGSALITEGQRRCVEEGHRIVIVLGHPEYYPRFGFSAELARRLRAPFSGPAFMALELVPQALSAVEGEVRYPPPFGV